MTTSFPTVTLTSTWVDLTVANPALANTNCVVQNLGRNALRVFFGGTTTPATADGLSLSTGEMFQGSSDHIWVRGDGSTQAAVAAL